MVFDPSLSRSDTQKVGVWRLDSWRLSSPQATMRLKEIKTTLGNLPLAVFESDDFPNAGSGVLGSQIPNGFGIVKGATAYPINTISKLFKVVNHAVTSFQAFYDNEGTAITPDVIDLANGEFTYNAWDGTTELFADFTAPGENPVDCIKLLLTDSVKGANLPLSDLDTTSTGNKGFGANGARLEYVYGIEITTDDEAVEFPIGLYINDTKDIATWIQVVAAASFALVYVDITGLYQIKSWKPQVSEDLDEITDANLRSVIVTEIMAGDVLTRVTSKYSQNHGLEDFQTFTHEDSRMRQLRGLTQHKTLEEELPLSNRFGARYWAQRTVAMRGVPRRLLKLQVTQEMMLKEPGDYVRVNSSRHDIDEVFEVLEVTINPGSLAVSLKLIDIRGFSNDEGFWTSSSTAWDDTWTDAQKKLAKENSGFWSDDDNYIDKIDDPAQTYRASVWV